ncbi:hypothetical protein [Streptomyces brasiliensis]|uniref:Uncharacterized protein n=1 Tax=Streptomyces brasiliensis TaxID=1954 RepID=A0A917NPB6_9ACTN|nr:hypothetical protein [Streptomyces brasiliensis]GGJ15385.1 hypothetical protein GCM10010121_027570 [Streptomyces brasiliensis]
MTATAPEAPGLTSQTWAGHWHGFGPWVGPPSTYAKEGNRRPPHPVRPAPEADHAGRYQEGAGEFATSSLPPLMSGHWLAKQGQTAADRTWTDVTDAVEWLKRHYNDQPPFERTDGLRSYGSLDGKIAYAYDVLPRGVDIAWVHYTQSRSLLPLSIVCCPNLFHPDLECPLLPRR